MAVYTSVRTNAGPRRRVGRRARARLSAKLDPARKGVPDRHGRLEERIHRAGGDGQHDVEGDDEKDDQPGSRPGRQAHPERTRPPPLRLGGALGSPRRSGDQTEGLAELWPAHGRRSRPRRRLSPWAASVPRGLWRTSSNSAPTPGWPRRELELHDPAAEVGRQHDCRHQRCRQQLLGNESLRGHGRDRLHVSVVAEVLDGVMGVEQVVLEKVRKHWILASGENRYQVVADRAPPVGREPVAEHVDRSSLGQV